MRQKPMRDQDNDGENAKLTHGTDCKYRYNAQDGIIRHNFECIRSSRAAQSFCDALLDGECDRRFTYRVYLIGANNPHE